MLELLGTFLLGMGVALLVSMTIFPLFATFDIENRVHYCLRQLDQMQTIILEAFLSEDPAAANVSLARASIVERRLRQTMDQMRLRLDEAAYEPSRLLQRLFNCRHKPTLDLSLAGEYVVDTLLCVMISSSVLEQEDLILTMMLHVCSLQAMIKDDRFNSYHNQLVHELDRLLSEFSLCQSNVIRSLISVPPFPRDEITFRLRNLQRALDSLNAGYQQFRLHRIEDVVERGCPLQSADHLSHAFFFFHLGAIVRLLDKATSVNSNRHTSNVCRKRLPWKNWLKFRLDRSRLLSAGKSTLIVGIGSVFIMIPRLAKIFAGGQWILLALCMTQGDTVGGTFITMKMRFMGTLLGKGKMSSMVDYRFFSLRFQVQCGLM